LFVVAAIAIFQAVTRRSENETNSLKKLNLKNQIRLTFMVFSLHHLPFYTFPLPSVGPVDTYIGGN